MNSRNKFNISLWERAVELEYNEREKERVDTLKALISTLKDYFKHKNIKKVFIVGSILKEGMFFHFSDIDIAVEGLKEGYFRSLSELEDLLKRDVDIIELESCRFRDLIEKHGIRVI